MISSTELMNCIAYVQSLRVYRLVQNVKSPS